MHRNLHTTKYDRPAHGISRQGWENVQTYIIHPMAQFFSLWDDNFPKKSKIFFCASRDRWSRLAQLMTRNRSYHVSVSIGSPPLRVISR